ncbi:MAG: TIGR00374 family protein, partial [Solirubrobacterales bacterium]
MSSSDATVPEAGTTAAGGLPSEFDTPTLRKRGLQALAAIAALAAVVLLAPGLGEIRSELSDADPGWLGLAA